MPNTSAKRDNCEKNVLVLQGGGALGAYQAGAYEGLSAAGIEPNWVAGISIGAINAAIIAGNRPEHRGLRLRQANEAAREMDGRRRRAARWWGAF